MILSSYLSSLISNDNKIPFYFLKSLEESILHTLTHLINTSLRLEALLPFLKRAKMIVIKKLDKSSYKTVNV